MKVFSTEAKRQARWDYFHGFSRGLFNELSRAEHATALVICEPKGLQEKIDSMASGKFEVHSRAVTSVDFSRIGYLDGSYSYRYKAKAIEE